MHIKENGRINNICLNEIHECVSVLSGTVYLSTLPLAQYLLTFKEHSKMHLFRQSLFCNLSLKDLFDNVAAAETLSILSKNPIFIDL